MASGVNGASLLQMNYGRNVARAAAVLPATTNQTIFTIAGGRILVTGLVGEVTTVMTGTATNVKVTSVSTTSSIASDMTANTAVTSLAVGALYSISGVAATAGTTGSAVAKNNELILPIGLIRITTDATNTGAMKWILTYVPLDPGASVAAA